MRLPAIILACLLALNADAQTTLKLVRTIPLPGVGGRIDHMAADTQGHRLFMAALGNDTVLIEGGVSQPNPEIPSRMRWQGRVRGKGTGSGW